MKVGQRIKKLRELRNYSQKYMAEQLEITQQNYSKMEMDEVDFPISRLAKIAEALHMRPADILTFDEQAIFNSYNVENITNGNGYVLRDGELLETLQKQYEERIQHLEEENKRLLGMLEKKFSN